MFDCEINSKILHYVYYRWSIRHGIILHYYNTHFCLMVYNYSCAYHFGKVQSVIPVTCDNTHLYYTVCAMCSKYLSYYRLKTTLPIK